MPVDLRDVGNWWAWTPGANWRHPEGKGWRTVVIHLAAKFARHKGAVVGPPV